MGPKGGDEVNLILPGRNYGYPNVSNGSTMMAATSPIMRRATATKRRRCGGTRSISPGGLMIYSGSMFPQWKGDAFIGGLSSQGADRAIDLDGTSAKKGDQWDMGARIREVEQAPDGAILVLEDGPQGRLLRLSAR